MKPFTYLRASNAGQAMTALDEQPRTKILGGGTNLIDLMKMGVEQPDRLVDINRLPLEKIEEVPGGLRIGALARNSDVAEHPLVVAKFPVLCQALLAGASPQLRNLATVGGNLLQRTRCYYFYDPSFPKCNKRTPGSGCGALEGYNRMHAILGQSDQCIATHPSDMCVAMAALEPTIQVRGGHGDRSIAFADFHRLPSDTPQVETSLATGELITSVELRALPAGAKSVYLKVRDRASYAFALISVAAVLEVEDGSIKLARIALGGVAHKPWRALEAEQQLLGKKPGEESFRAAAETALHGARGYQYNTFKIELAKRTIVRALKTVAAL
jgi:xanthine dehydrogenase YagS FAD-binding subunit